MVTHPAMHIHLVVFSLCSTVGQLFIFKTIKAFGPVAFAICMNTRIIASILLVCSVYSHDISITGFMGLVIVFGAIAYRIKRKMGNQRLGDLGRSPTTQKSMTGGTGWHEAPRHVGYRGVLREYATFSRCSCRGAPRHRGRRPPGAQTVNRVELRQHNARRRRRPVFFRCLVSLQAASRF